MTRFTLLIASLATLLVCAFAAVPAHAQTRVFVAAQGSDGNPCTFASPCRTFQHAHDVVAANGEIDVLDPAGYGTMNINKAISIQGHGFSGISTTSGATAITINAGANDAINLRGLLLEGFGTGSVGILFNAGASLNIQDSLIRNFADYGIKFQPTAASQLNVSQTLVSDLGSAGTAVRIPPSPGGTANAVLNRVELDRGHNGLVLDSSIGVTITDSVISNYNNFGILNFLAIFVMVRNCTVSSNKVGITADGPGSIVRVTRSTISANATGLLSSDGTLISYGDNNLDGNTTNGAFTTTIAFH